MAIVMHPDGRSELVRFEAGPEASDARVLAGAGPLAQLQAAVGGYIEPIYLGPKADGRRDVMIVNEDGRSLRLPVNPTATLLAAQVGNIAGPIVGVAVLCVVEHEGEEDERWI